MMLNNVARLQKEMPMLSAKQKVSELLTGLPDDCTIEDIQYHLYVMEKIERGLKDLEEGRVLKHEDVEGRMAKWLDK